MFNSFVSLSKSMSNRYFYSFLWRILTLRGFFGAFVRGLSLFFLFYSMLFALFSMVFVFFDFFFDCLVFLTNGEFVTTFGIALKIASLVAIPFALFFMVNCLGFLFVPPTLDELREDFIKGRITKSMFCKYYPIVKERARDWEMKLEREKNKEEKKRAEVERLHKEFEDRKKELEEVERARAKEVIEIVRELEEQFCKTKEEE